MGSFNVACSISGISLSPGDRCCFIPLEENPYTDGQAKNNSLLIYADCYYHPLTLPLFGIYDDYGMVELDKGLNLDIALAGLGLTNLDDIFKNCIPEKADSGMFIHEEVYRHLVDNHFDGFSGKKGWNPKYYEKFLRPQLEGGLEKLHLKKLELEKIFEEAKKDPKIEAYLLTHHKNNIKFLYHNSYDYSYAHFRGWESFTNIYISYYGNSEVRTWIADLYYFHMNMQSVNRFYFPANNGEQCGNPFAVRALARLIDKITSIEIVERKKER